MNRLLNHRDAKHAEEKSGMRKCLEINEGIRRFMESFLFLSDLLTAHKPRKLCGPCRMKFCATSEWVHRKPPSYWLEL
jgi:hypothetical protein